MNEEQFENLMINSAITIFLSEQKAKELVREYKVDNEGNLWCNVTSKTFDGEEINFTVSKNENGEYHAKFR